MGRLFCFNCFFLTRRHVNPTLDLVAELIKRGYKVTYYASEKFRSRLEAIGATLVWCVLLIPLNALNLLTASYDEGIQFKLTRTEKNIFNTALEMLTACELIMDSLSESVCFCCREAILIARLAR